MRIAVFTDLRFIESRSPTGVGKHIVQMVGGLRKTPANDVFLLAARDQFRGGEMYLAGVTDPLPVRRLPLSWKAAEALWTLVSGPAVDRYCEDADWVYCPKNDYIPLRNTSLAVTIHGAHELDPQVPQPSDIGSRLYRIRRRLSYRRITARATLVLTVSEYLKAQIVDWYGCDERNVIVVGNGVETEYFDAAGLPDGSSGRPADRPYLLCVGGLNALDGGQLVVEVARRLATTQPDLQILVAGQHHDARYLAAARQLPNLELAGYVPAKKLARLMRDAQALLYLPTYETFGIVAAEAMAVGAPVITAGGTAVPEVVGDAGLYASPDARDLVAKVDQVLRDSALRDSLRQAGWRRAKDYTWQACVARLNSALIRGRL